MKPMRQWSKLGLVGVLLFFCGVALLFNKVTLPFAFIVLAAGAVCIAMMRNQLPPQEGSKARWRFK